MLRVCQKRDFTLPLSLGELDRINTLQRRQPACCTFPTDFRVTVHCIVSLGEQLRWGRCGETSRCHQREILWGCCDWLRLWGKYHLAVSIGCTVGRFVREVGIARCLPRSLYIVCELLSPSFGAHDFGCVYRCWLVGDEKKKQKQDPGIGRGEFD